MTHEIKIKEAFADAVAEGRKTFEVRLNDRGYQVGDKVKFIPIYNSDNYEMSSHPIKKKEYEITYVLSGWGIKEDCVAFGIKEVRK